MSLYANMHSPISVEGAAQPMKDDPFLGNLQIKDRHGNRISIFMPAHAALAMARAYSDAMQAAE